MRTIVVASGKGGTLKSSLVAALGVYAASEAKTALIDLNAENLNPDGAVVDAEGNLWIAQWGAGRVAGYDGKGRFVRAFELPAIQVTCPAFGGRDYATLYVTSAADGLSHDVLRAAPSQGMTFELEVDVKGLPEPKVLL